MKVGSGMRGDLVRCHENGRRRGPCSKTMSRRLRKERKGGGRGRVWKRKEEHTCAE